MGNLIRKILEKNHPSTDMVNCANNTEQLGFCSNSNRGEVYLGTPQDKCDDIVVSGGNKLHGKVVIQSSKNAILPIMAGAILGEGKTVLHNIPKLLDISNMVKILKDLGVGVNFSHDMQIECKDINKITLDENLSSRLRSSIFLLGPMLAKKKEAIVAFPGGCNIGKRPIDLHLNGLSQIGVKVEQKGNCIYCDGSDMHAGEVYLDFASVGATENLMMASVFLDGKTKIFNSAREPEIVDLQNFLNSMGANISGAGTGEITINGVEKLHATQYTPIGDRIVAGTYLIACAMTGGTIEIVNVNPKHLLPLLKKLQEAGCDVVCSDNSIILTSKGKLKSVKHTSTSPYPGFPTDLQAPFMAMQSISKGVAVIHENIFENRYQHAYDLEKMGADISIDDRVATINGVERLYGAEVKASDLRGGASLVLAGLVADGKTSITNTQQILRGYEDIVRDLSILGADIGYLSEKNKENKFK